MQRDSSPKHSRWSSKLARAHIESLHVHRQLDKLNKFKDAITRLFQWLWGDNIGIVNNDRQAAVLGLSEPSVSDTLVEGF